MISEAEQCSVFFCIALAEKIKQKKTAAVLWLAAAVLFV